MDFNTAREWILFVASLLAWAFSLGVIWTKLNGKIDSNTKETEKKASIEALNGFGTRVTNTEGECSKHAGRMDRFERELGEFRAETRSVTESLARIETSVKDQTDVITNGNLATGVTLDSIKKDITAMDKNLGNRMTRVETVQQIEKKIGPIPTD